jgi:hypothetical protein
MIQIPTFIVDAIDGGIRVTIERDTTYGIRFDMNLGAKSHMYIVFDQGCWWALMRYDEKHQISDVEELKWAARHGMHGRDYIDSNWAEYLLTDEQRAERQMARDALSKLSLEEQRAVKGYFQ